MGVMQSPSKNVQRLRFNPIPNDRAITGKIAKINRTIVILTEKGTLFTNELPQKSVFCSGSWSWSEDITTCLDLLGVLTPEDKKQHLDYIHRQDRYSDIAGALHAAKGGIDDLVSEGLTSIKVILDTRKLIQLWNELPYYRQRQNLKNMPKGAKFKPKPKPTA
jgi:hypothetical protein